MKRLFYTSFLVAMFCIAEAQENPYSKYGYEPQIVTMSNGKFNEFHDQDTIVQIGRVVYNTKSMTVLGFIEYDTLYSEADLSPDIVSRWLSPDPLAAEFPSRSPYEGFASNPIYFIDPDGRAVKPANESGAAAFYNIVASLGGQDFFGLQVNGQGKNAYYTTNLNWSVEKFTKKAGKSLSGDQLANAVSVFRILQAQDIVEIGVVDAQTTQSNVENTRNVQTQNDALTNFMIATDADKNLSAFDTKTAINGLLSNGSPNGEGFGFFKDQQGGSVTNYTSTSLTPERRSLNGILIIDTPFNGGETTRSFGSDARPTRTIESTLMQGINAIQDEL